MAGWYIRRGEKIVGPVEQSKLQELVATGRLLPTDQLAKEIAGPWNEAGRTTLFAKPKPSTTATPELSPNSLVAKPEGLPDVVRMPESTRTATQIGRAFFAGIGRGMLVTWGVVSRSMATRSQRRHEIRLAKIQAKALVDSQRVSAPQRNVQAPPGTTPTKPVVFAPQIHQTTVVQVVSKNKQTAYGCSGCGVVLLLILIGFIVLAIVSSATPR